MGCYNYFMGIFEILFGGSSKPRVTEKEYGKVKNKLINKGFTERERAKVDDIFGSEFYMPGTDLHPRGIEKTELEAKIKWMRENKSKHRLSDNRINEIETSLIERL